MASRRVWAHPGGIVGLEWLLAEHFEPLEADFARYYSTDLRAAVWGPSPMGARRLIALARYLPRESATARAAGGELADWSRDTALLADLFDAVQAGTVALLRAWGGKLPDPERYPRPGDVTERPRMASAAELRTFLATSGTNVNTGSHGRDV